MASKEDRQKWIQAALASGLVSPHHKERLRLLLESNVFDNLEKCLQSETSGGPIDYIIMDMDRGRRCEKHVRDQCELLGLGYTFSSFERSVMRDSGNYPTRKAFYERLIEEIDALREDSPEHVQTKREKLREELEAYLKNQPPNNLSAQVMSLPRTMGGTPTSALDLYKRAASLND